MTPDHYATLEIAPTSDDAVIRAAYLALMRRYHPDRNSSAEAATRARAVTAAYAVLGDKHRRAEYDYKRAAAVSAKASRQRPPAKPVAPFAVAAILLLLLVLWVIWSPLPVLEQPDRPRGAQAREAEAVAKANPAAPCSSKATHERIKRELFRRAALLRGSDAATFDRLAGYSLVRVDSPVLTGQNEVLGTISCEANVALDLPPGVAVLGGRRTLTDDIRYSLEADGSDLISVSNEGLIVTPLATLARIARPVEVAARLSDSVADEPARARERPAEPPPPIPPPRASAPPLPAPPARVAAQPAVAQPRPSFSCRFAKARGEIAVCGNANLARLDRHLAMLYGQSWGTADATKRASLLSTRDGFLARRDACRSVSCVNRVYVGRMREISDIMAAN